MNLLFRPLTKEDIDELIVIEREAFPTPWTAKMYREELRNHLAHYWVVRADGVLAAYGGFWLIEEEAHITNLAVAKDFRGQGLGSLLLGNLIQIARNYKAVYVTLEVRPSNAVAIGLYEKFGFISHGRRPHYYEDNGEDALIMWLTIPANDGPAHPWSI